LPALSALTASSLCVNVGVQISTMSTLLFSRISSKLATVAPYFSEIAFALLSIGSTIQREFLLSMAL
jgi:hypothetical protein